MVVKTKVPIFSNARGRNISLNTRGDVLAQKQEDGRQLYLIKFSGFGWPIQVERSQVEVICNDGEIL